MKADKALEARARDPDRWKRAVVAALEKDEASPPIAHTLQVTSFGGAGTNALIEHLERAGCDLPKTAGHYPFKHGRPPRDGDAPEGYRVIYVYGDPRNTVISLFRRNLQVVLYRWLNMTPPSPEVEERLSSLDAFLGGGVDTLGFEQHVDRWLERESVSYPVMFVRYECLPDAWDGVREFVRLPPNHPCYPVTPRGSDWTSLPPAQRRALDAMYGTFAHRISQQPATTIR